MKKVSFLFMIVALAFTTLLCPGKQGDEATEGDAIEEGAEESGTEEAPAQDGAQ